ncbi:UvrD-helicase domain-containing protein [Methanococcoides sp. NM1]|uniref:UvrD-helicase domain-containing protein n=1 Tax=Methanococcoides sp. NM1 TaxID=1201013 RepID=UPI0014383D68|nr:UvrD-helicase domain-containing protein [Methanococcoides sp. NM1]
MIVILDEDIKYAEKIFLPEGASFDTERVDVIKCMESKDIQACPGSGKTTTLLAKLAILAQKMPLEGNKGICVLTHTNVAINEIKDKLGSKGKILFEYPNFFGTIQSFVDKFLAIPACVELVNNKPHIIDDEVYNDVIYKKYAYLNYRTKAWVDRQHNPVQFMQSIRFSSSDINLLENVANLKTRTTHTYKTLYKIKLDILKSGILCFDDAYSLSFWYLRNHSEALKSIFSERFAFVFLDEMQDTSCHQNKIFDLIFNDTNIIVQKLGDSNQSIYEDTTIDGTVWDIDESCLCINGSKRFSESIASCVKHVCKDPHEIIGNTSRENISPIVITYDDDTIGDVIHYFSEIIEEKGLQSNENTFKAAGWVGQVKEGKRTIPSYFPSYQKKATNKSNYATLGEYLKIADDEQIKIKGVDFYRNAIIEALLKILRTYNIKNEKSRYYTVSSFLKHIRENDIEFNEQFNLKLTQWCLKIQNGTDITDDLRRFIENDFSGFFEIPNISSLESFFDNQPVENSDENCESKQNAYVDDSGIEIEIEIATVHSVKGETHTATLYLETYHKRGYDVGRILNHLQKPSSSPNSITLTSLKMCYVGMTRPTHLLCVAAHQDSIKNKEEYLHGNGWEIRYLTKDAQPC